MTEHFGLLAARPLPIAAPRYALAAKFSVAVAALLAVLVPATLSYGGTFINRPIENLTFSAGHQVQRSADLAFTNALSTNPLWSTSVEGSTTNHAVYESITGMCTVNLIQTNLPESIASSALDDHVATVAYLQSIFPDGEQKALTDAPTDTRIGFVSPDAGSGRTMDGLVLSNDVSTMIFRAVKATRDVLIVNVVCDADSEEGNALTADALLHISVTAK